MKKIYENPVMDFVLSDSDVLETSGDSQSKLLGKNIFDNASIDPFGDD